MGELHRIVQTQTVIGEPVKAGDLTLIPVSKITFGFGAGGGETEKAQGLAREAGRKLDKAVSKGVIHKNQGANRKSSIGKRAAAL